MALVVVDKPKRKQSGPKKKKKLKPRLPGGDIGSESHFEYWPGEKKITYKEWLKKMQNLPSSK